MQRISLRLFISVAAVLAGCGYGKKSSSSNNSSPEETLAPTEQKDLALPTVANNLVCPTGYISVPEYTDTDLATVPAFCVMKYEAKKVNSVAKSQASGIPWTSISRNDARNACSALSNSSYTYKLVTNVQWQSMARQIERYAVSGTYVNWQGGSPAEANALNRGNSDSYRRDSEIEHIFAADASDANGCSGTYEPSNCSGSWHLYKRTHTLPNGEIIWDLAGNVKEWVYDDSSFDYGSDAYISAITESYGNAGGPLGTPKAAFGPYGNYSGKSSAPYGGLGQGGISDTRGTVLRGGYHFDGDDAGLFAVELTYGPNGGGENMGFRCAAVP